MPAKFAIVSMDDSDTVFPARTEIVPAPSKAIPSESVPPGRASVAELATDTVPVSPPPSIPRTVMPDSSESDPPASFAMCRSFDAVARASVPV